MVKVFVVLCILAVMVVSFIYYGITYVKKNSIRYRKLLEINEEFESRTEDYRSKVHRSYKFNTKAKYDNVNNREKVLKEHLNDDKEYFHNVLVQIDTNKMCENIYSRRVHGLNGVSSIDKFKYIEDKLIFNHTGLNFKQDFSLQFDMKYSSPKGRNNYKTTIKLDADDILKILVEIQEEFVDKTEYEIFRDGERAKMTAGFRYDILKRDNFTCQLCGAKAITHDVTLHVDHIKPVKKGGLTVEDNLQTLCRDCNLGKGTKD